MEKSFIAAKYENKWSVFDKTSRTFSYIGKGKRFCEKKARQLNEDLEKIFDDPLLAWVTPESVKKMSEVVRDVFPNATKEEVDGWLKITWMENDTPETLYEKLSILKNA
jgi:hypothetical protein